MIDLAQARSLLLAAVNTKGRDFVYNPIVNGRTLYDLCKYEVDTTTVGPMRETRCLIGTALTLAGETRHHGRTESVRVFLRLFPDMLTDDAADYFVRAQHSQDYGSTWGEAYDIAEKWAEAEESVDAP